MKFASCPLLALLALAASADAAVLGGQVATADGAPVAGALVTLWNEARNRKETVYTDADGRYRLETGFAGAVQLRGRATMYRDFLTTFTLAADADEQHNLVLEKLREQIQNIE